jgi:hypothetical protein
MPKGLKGFQKGHRELRSVDGIKRMSGKIKGKPAWNKGLTKETDERLKVMSEKLKGRKSWSEGKKLPPHTKEWKENMKEVMEKLWAEGKMKGMTGKVAHNKGKKLGFTPKGAFEKETPRGIRVKKG